jgi:hypothetical protein
MPTLQSALFRPQPDLRRLLYLLLIMVAAVLVGVVPSHRALYIDGAYYLLHILDTGTFLLISPVRSGVNVFVQWLPVAAVQSGIRNIEVISWLFSLNYYLPVILSPLLTWAVLPENSRNWIVLPLMHVLFWFTLTSMAVVSETAGVVLFFWPVYFSFFTEGALTKAGRWIFWVCAVFLSFSYEMAVVPVAALLLIAVWKRRPVESIALLLSAVWTGSTLLGRANPVNTDSWTLFFQWFDVLEHGPAIATFGMTALVLTGMFSTAKFRRVLHLPALVFVGILVLVHRVDPEVMHPGYLLKARFLNVFFPFLLIPVHFWFTCRNSISNVVFPVRLMYLWTIAASLFVIESSLMWNKYCTSFFQFTQSETGLVNSRTFELTTPKTIVQYHANWTAPVMSIVIPAVRGEKTIKTMVLNADSTLWSPFSGTKPSEWPDLNRYHLTYHPDLWNRAISE